MWIMEGRSVVAAEETKRLSFEHARYTSPYLAFVPVEWFGQAADPGTPFGHVYLQRPTIEQTLDVLRRFGEEVVQKA